MSDKPKNGKYVEEYTCDGVNAPARLRGRKLVVIFDAVKGNLEFQFDMPDNPTANEIGYVKLFCTDVAEKAGANVHSRTIEFREE